MCSTYSPVIYPRSRLLPLTITKWRFVFVYVCIHSQLKNDEPAETSYELFSLGQITALSIFPSFRHHGKDDEFVSTIWSEDESRAQRTEPLGRSQSQQWSSGVNKFLCRTFFLFGKGIAPASASIYDVHSQSMTYMWTSSIISSDWYKRRRTWGVWDCQCTYQEQSLGETYDNAHQIQKLVPDGGASNHVTNQCCSVSLDKILFNIGLCFNERVNNLWFERIHCEVAGTDL